MRILCLLIVAVSLLANSAVADPPRWMLKAKLKDQWVEGMPLAWSQREVRLLARDGYIWVFDPREAKESAKTSDTFRPLSAAEIRGRLLAEFGKGFDVSGTGHYLVVHPAGQENYWPARFEELYRSFMHYFAARGFRPREPEFPLVAIVVQRADDLHRYAAKEGLRLPRGVLGYYSQISNRVILFDQGGGKASQKDWAANSETIIHETTHQTAFNTGVHTRAGTTPRWLAEGLGTLFEAPGVWNSRFHPNQSDRINPGRLADFKKLVAPKLNAETLAKLIANDGMFNGQPSQAYALSWALSFYLVETQSGKYSQYLATTARRDSLSGYSAAERTKDFTAIFGNDFRMLTAQFARYMENVR